MEGVITPATPSVYWLLARCTGTVYRGAGQVLMAATKQIPDKSKNAAQPRASVTFPPELYKNLEDLARKKKVSLAWIVREAAEKYVADQWPLFGATLLGEKR